MGRTSDARERLVAAGRELFAERAYGSIGVAEICARAGVQKGSFYYFFPSKEALALAVVDSHWEDQRREWQAILDGDGPFVERLRRLFEATTDLQEQALRGTGSVTGCLFGNLALEVSARHEPLQARLQAIFDEQIDLIQVPLAAAVEAGELSVADVAAAAKAIVAQLEGLVLFAKLFNDPSQLDSLWRSSLQLLGMPAGSAV